MVRMLTTLNLPILLALAGCTAAPRADIYAGPVRPISGTCDPLSRGTLAIEGTGFIFAPQSGTLILQGNRAGPHLNAMQERRGADKTPYKLRMEATLQGAHIEGFYSTPACRYQLSLVKTRD